MNEALLDLLFWIVVLIVLFFGLRYLQGRRNRKDDEDKLE